MEQTFKTTLDKLNRRLPYLNKSQSNKYNNDAIYFQAFLEEIEMDLGNICWNKRFPYDPILYLENLDTWQWFASSVGEASKKAIDEYQANNYFNYGRNVYDKLKNPLEIVRNFFEYFFPEGNIILDKMLNNNHILYINKYTDYYGATFPLTETDESYILLNEFLIDNDLQFIKTIIHEVMHVYSFMFLKRYSMTNHLSTGILGETISMYSGLSLEYFLKKERLLNDKLEFFINNRMFSDLSFYKKSHYLSEAAKQQADITIVNNDYAIHSDIQLPESEYPYDYDSELYSSGGLEEIQYSIGNLFANELLAREKNGENIVRNVNDFLLNIDSEETWMKVVNQDFNYNLIGESIKTNNEKIKKMYKLK